MGDTKILKRDWFTRTNQTSEDDSNAKTESHIQRRWDRVAERDVLRRADVTAKLNRNTRSHVISAITK